jgi:hypothetical protein
LIWLGLGAATALGVVLRVVFIGDQSFGYEEWYTLAVVGHPSVGAVWRSVNATESTPPLYYLLTWLWVKVTASDTAVSLRMISLLAGSLTVPAAFLAMRSFFDRRLALVAAWLCAISPELVGYSIYARSYALLVLAATVSVWALGLLLEKPSRRRWVFWAMAATACLWTHYFAVFLIAAETVALLVLFPQQRRILLLALAVTAVASAPLVPLFVSQSGASDRTAYIGASSLTTRLESTVREFSMGSNVPTAWLEGTGIMLVVAAAAFAAARTYRRRSTRVLLAIAVIGGGLPILSALLGVDDHFLSRNILGVWICLIPLAAYGLTRLKSIPLLAYSVICVVAVIWVEGDWRYQGAPDWGGASARIQQRAAGDPVAVLPGIELPVAALYLHRAQLSAPAHTSDLWVMVQPARAAHERALNPVPDPPLTQLWGTGFREIGEIDYRGFRLIHLHAAAPTTVLPAPPNDGPAVARFALTLAAG